MTFTILAYNINGGVRARVDDLSAVLAQANADLVALTEADDPETVAALAERGRYHSVWARGTGDRHAAVLARRPITAWHNWAAPPLTQAAVEVRLAEPARMMASSRPTACQRRISNGRSKYGKRCRV